MEAYGRAIIMAVINTIKQKKMSEKTQLINSSPPQEVKLPIA